MSFIYESKFIKIEESFLRKDILKAIQLTNKIVSRRVGFKIYSSYLPIDFLNNKGRFSGLVCLFGSRGCIRYNWKLNDTSGEIISIDFWTKSKCGVAKPDYTLETEGINIIKLIDAITSILNKEGNFEFQVIQESKKDNKYNEDFIPKTKGQVSRKITDALKQWALDKDVTDDKLQNTRISYLYKDFQFWFMELASPEFESMSEITFRTYILNFLKDRGLNNIYVRNLVLRSGNKEKIIVTDKASEVAYQDISHLKMNVGDLKDFIGDSVRAVTRGYQNSLIVAGKAGIGKTTITQQILKDEGMQFYVVPQIRNVSVLYNLFIHNNDPKKVIVFDDTTDLFDKKFSGYLSAALDDKPNRIINFPSELGKDIADFAKYGSDLNFQGKIIILTNVPKNKIPQFLKSRSITIEVQATNSEMSDEIRKNLANVLPEVDMDKKVEVLDFIEKLGKEISSLDYRQFKLAVVFKISGSPDWKKRVYALLK